MRAASVLVLLLASCAPSLDAADVIGAYRGSRRRIDASAAQGLRPWAVGQWALYKLAIGNHVGYVKHGVVAVGACGTWIESTYVMGKYKDRTTVKVCYQGANGQPNSDDIDRTAALMMRRGDSTLVVDFRNGQNPRTKARMKASLSGFATLAYESPPTSVDEEIIVPAGHFVGVKKVVTRVWVEESMQGAEVWTHADVPLSGTVKMISSTGTDAVLLDYGLTGAEDELPDFDAHLKATGLD